MTSSDTLKLACELISRASVTPEDAGCQEIMIKRLQALGFTIERMRFGAVDNFWARRGQKSPLLTFAGHTDVVSSGPEQEWHTPPFEPTLKDGYLYGRGAADMKGSLAAWLIALENFIEQYPNHPGSLALLITSDEEGVAVDGTVRVIVTLEARNEKIDWCIVGEPSSSNQVGDTIKHGRRGSLTGVITVHGVQGHVAYPDLVDNPIHKAAPALAKLAATTWDQGNDDFPPTSFQIANIQAGTGATNVVPGKLQLQCNFRYSTAVTENQLITHTESILDDHQLDYKIEWILNGIPFLTPYGRLIAACQQSIQQFTGIEPLLSTAGGTSDGRFIAPTGAQVVEIGPCNDTIHKLNECVKLADLGQLTAIYGQIMVNLLQPAQ